MESFLVNTISLGSPPISLGAVPRSEKVFVSQEHPDGRITFIDWTEETTESVTGFELNSRIRESTDDKFQSEPPMADATHFAFNLDIRCVRGFEKFHHVSPTASGSFERAGRLDRSQLERSPSARRRRVAGPPRNHRTRNPRKHGVDGTPHKPQRSAGAERRRPLGRRPAQRSGVSWRRPDLCLWYQLRPTDSL